MRLPHRIGDFVIAGNPLAETDQRSESLYDLGGAVRRALSIGEQRTIDVMPPACSCAHRG